MPDTVVEGAKREVRDFWEAAPCGAKHAAAAEGTPEFFAQVEAERNRLEPFIADYADFAGTRGQRLLEIGVGLGTDFVRFARAGAQVTGVDLTEHSVRLVQRRLELEGLEGEVRVADAERLPFPDGAFDVVYSWGVLHHTPAPDRAIAEALRLLRPGGRLCLMLYARRSWVAFGLWARYALLAGRPNRSLAWALSHHMESAGTQGYTPREIRARLEPQVAELTVEHVGTPYDRRVVGPLARVTGGRLGWFLVIRGVKRPA
jgi:SAM-dependent methyltransferase